MTLFHIGMIAMRVLGFAFFVLFTARIAAGVRGRRGCGYDTLRERLARGEIDVEEYRRLRDAMES